MYYQRPLFIRIIESFCRHWRIFVATTAAIVLMLVIFIVTRPKQYVSQYTVILNTQTLVNPESNQAEIIDWNAVNQNVGHFQTLVQTKDFVVAALSPINDPSAGQHLNQRIDFDNDDDLTKLQKGISVTANGSDAFTVGLIWSDSTDSELILSALISKFMERTAQEKSASFTQQVAFDKQNLDEFSSEQSDASARLTAFSTQHLERLPSEQGALLQDLANQKQRLRDEQLQVVSDQSRVALLQQDVTTIPQQIVSNETQTTSPLDVQISALSLQLDKDIANGMRPDHPEVKNLEKQIDTLKAIRVKRNATNGETSNIASEDTQPNPAYQAAKYQLDNLKIDIQGEQTKAAQLSQQIDQETSGISKMPEETREYTSLLGLYQFYTDQLQKAQNALQDAKDNEEISLKEQQSNYTPLETMQPELSTSKSKTAILFAGGLVLALLVSSALVVLAEAMDRSFRDPFDLQRTLGVPVLAMLPESSDLHIADSRTLLTGSIGAKRLTTEAPSLLPGDASAAGPGDLSGTNPS